MFAINWTLNAELTFLEEIEFISKKWQTKQIEKFVDLVDNRIKDLSSGIIEGKPSNIKNVRILVISKQTTLVYKINRNESRIDLITFWNNKVNPENYKKYLEF